MGLERFDQFKHECILAGLKQLDIQVEQLNFFLLHLLFCFLLCFNGATWCWEGAMVYAGLDKKEQLGSFHTA